MTIKEILIKMDKFNELAKTFNQNTLHAYVDIGGIEAAYQSGKEFIKYIKTEWTNEFAAALYEAEFKDVSSNSGNAVYESLFTMHGLFYTEDYRVTVYIEKD